MSSNSIKNHQNHDSNVDPDIDTPEKQSSKLSFNLQSLIRESDLTISQLSRKTGLAQPVLHRICKGVTENPSVLTLSPLAKFFGVSISQLIGDESLVSDQKKMNHVPLVSWDTAYDWIKNKKKTKAVESVTTDKETNANMFALLIKQGDLNWQFPTGTILIFDSTLSPQNMDFSLVYEKNTPLSLKQVFIEGKSTYLKPLNASLEVLKMTKSQSFIGVLIQAKKDFSE